MPTLVAMIRGINLGRINRLSMGDLARVIQELGGEHSRTYLQSGNVVFDGPLGARPDAAAAIAGGIREANRLTVDVITRRADELRAIAAMSPFPNAQPAALHVTFLSETPDADRVAAIDRQRFAPDALEVAGREIYLHCPNGYGTSKLSNAFFQKRFGVVATTRNLKTVQALAELASETPARE
ncbi:MAG: DUF1697 domain-containing protein, partial [Chloroflexi bacterium]|nr:DUF1697 domain-containing protein [Chloroflexota bacterium]